MIYLTSNLIFISVAAGRTAMNPGPADVHLPYHSHMTYEYLFVIAACTGVAYGGMAQV
jgi:hypothetical protein